MSHNGYVQGLLENGCRVDILMADDSWGEQDNALPNWEQATYYRYPAVSFQDRLRRKSRGTAPVQTPVASGPQGEKKADIAVKVKTMARKLAKSAFYACFPADPVYPLEKTWLNNARKFKSDTEYDLVVSNSSPAASHKLAGILIKNKQIKTKRWIQIWEDPWFFDLYGGHAEAIREEEHALLREAGEIYYVSPLTLKYQQQHFPDCANKMKHIPLPYLESAAGTPKESAKKLSVGYFGDYYSQTRNLRPLYDALLMSECVGNIYGDSDVNLSSTERITVSGRVTLDILSKVQENTTVLVHLSNLKGGQIPGKIYHYSATTKPILFVLDGTAEEQNLLRDYFEQFNRYYFCQNSEESIVEALRKIQEDIAVGKTWAVVESFSPKEVVRLLLNEM
jgi:hypothetical protein